jgi:ABC-type multidrug transport system permease subunit
VEKEEKNLEGIGGWLILVAIGIVVAPIRLIIVMTETYRDIFSTGAWEVLTNPSSESYNDLLGPIIIGEIAINIAIIIFLFYMAYLFFCKKSGFPKLFIGIAVFTLVFIIADAFVVKLVIPSEPVFDPDTVRELVRSLVAVVVWVPYMIVSKRVKATFTK